MNKVMAFNIAKIVVAVAVGVCLLFPIYLLGISSVKETEDVFDMRMIPRSVTVEGYKVALEQNFLRYFSNSLIVAVTVTVVALIFHSMAG